MKADPSHFLDNTAKAKEGREGGSGRPDDALAEIREELGKQETKGERGSVRTRFLDQKVFPFPTHYAPDPKRNLLQRKVRSGLPGPCC